MSPIEVVRTVGESYVIVTLCATSLAKLKNWRVSTVGMQRERVVPLKAAPVVIIAVAIVEFSLATLLMLGNERVAVALATTVLFLLFGGYQLAVAAKTNSLMCSCAGSIRNDPASLPAVVGTIIACLAQAGLAAILIAGASAGGAGRFLLVAAWTGPFIFFAIGAWRQSNRPDIGSRFPVELAG